MSVDYLRVILAGFVVLAHSGLARETLRETGQAGLWGLAAGNSILRVAVPVFTLIAGYFLASALRRGRLSDWVGHLLMLYAIWSAIYLLFLWPYYANRPVSLTATELVLGFMHLWFLQGLAVSGVILAGAIRLGRGAVIGSAILLGLLGLGLQYAKMSGLSDMPVEHYRNGPVYLYPYLAMGWLIACRPPHLSLAALWAMVAAGLALTLAENIWWLHRIGEDPLLEIPLGHLALCPALLLLVMRLPAPATALPLGRAAAGIYVLHVIVLQGLPRIGLPDPGLGAVLGFVLPFLLVWAVSTAGGRHRWLARLF
ncbi:acyltransferase family protein [Paracoccus nototheniae]